MASSEKDIAMSYQSYRTLKAEIREREKGIYRQIGELVDASNEKLLSENANKDAKNYFCSKRFTSRNFFKRLLLE